MDEINQPVHLGGVRFRIQSPRHIKYVSRRAQPGFQHFASRGPRFITTQQDEVRVEVTLQDFARRDAGRLREGQLLANAQHVNIRGDRGQQMFSAEAAGNPGDAIVKLVENIARVGFRQARVLPLGQRPHPRIDQLNHFGSPPALVQPGNSAPDSKSSPSAAPSCAAGTA